MTEKQSAFDQLNPRHKVFLLDYLIDFNGTRAYKQAYPSCRKDTTAMAASSRLLRNVKIKAALNEKAKQFLDDKEFQVFRISKELKRNATADIKEYLSYLETGDIGELKNIDTRPISSIEIKREISKDKSTKEKTVEDVTVKIRLWDKNRASEVLGKYIGIAETHRLVDKDDNDLFEAFLKNLNEE